MLLNRNELEELMMLLDETFHHVKDCGNQHLASGLIQQHSIIKNKLDEMDTNVEVFAELSYEQLECSNSLEEIGSVSITDSDQVPCRFCGVEYNKIITTMQFYGGEGTETTMELIINGEERITVTELDECGTGNNYHILFSCGNGHFHVKSYEEHEGIVLTDSNELMDELTLYLNAAYEQSHDLDRTFDDELLHFIKEFLTILNKRVH